MRTFLTVLCILTSICVIAGTPKPSFVQPQHKCADTIHFSNGTTEVVTFKRQNRSKIFYKACSSDFSLSRSVPVENVDKVVLSSGEVIVSGRENKKERNFFVKVLIALGLGIAVIAVGFGLIILIYAIAQPW